MGVCSSKKQKKENELTFYETSDEYWAFGKEHLDALQQSLQIIKLRMMEEIILECLGKMMLSEWNHPNYTTFIHIRDTPLSDGWKPLSRVLPAGSLNCHVAVLGMPGVGKTNLIRRFKGIGFNEDHNTNYYSQMSMEDEWCEREIAMHVPREQYDNRKYESQNADGTQKMMIRIYDSSAHTMKCHSIYIDWLMGSDICFLVFSVIDKRSFESLKTLRDEIWSVKKKESPIIVVGNKCDLRTDLDYDDYGNAVDMDEVEMWCYIQNFPYIETSAKIDKNINLLFRHCVYEYHCLLLL